MGRTSAPQPQQGEQRGQGMSTTNVGLQARKRPMTVNF